MSDEKKGFCLFCASEIVVFFNLITATEYQHCQLQNEQNTLVCNNSSSVAIYT
jgi:hypothetical protein